jgi:4-carboxymuconolactone decarboxylase
MRLPPIPDADRTPEQKQVAKAIADGPRGDLRGPFNALLRSPVVADRVAKLGEYLRFQTSIPFDLNELAILVTGRNWDAQYEFYAHANLARKAGLPEHIIQAIAEGRKPEPMTADQALVWQFATELHANRNVSDATYAAAKARFGEQGVIDLVAVQGYYVLVGMTLNVAGVPLPPGEPVPLKPLAR